MHDTPLIFDLVVALVAAFAGGMVARRLGLPVIVGYIAGGAAIGSHTPGLTIGHDNVENLAHLGVGFLMFALGVEFSLNDLARVRRVALITGGVQIPVTIAIGVGVGTLFGWSWQASALLGGAFAISSSIVAIKTLMGRGEGTSPQATTTLGISVVQDLALVPMVALLPVLEPVGDGGSLVWDVARAMGVAALAIGLVVLIGTRVVPRIFSLVARTESRELFLLTVVLIAFGAAYAAERAGLSLALGAFLAGLVVSESEFDTRVLADTIPFRDFFSILFFVSVGMLFDPGVLIEQPGMVAIALAALMLGKLLVTGGMLLAVRIDHVTATLTAILLAQMGEFSFLLAGLGRERGIIDSGQYALILVTAVGSIVAMPPLLATAPTLERIAGHLPRVHAREQARAGFIEQADPPAVDVLITGYGRVGRELGAALLAQGIPFAVIDLNPGKIRLLRRSGIPAYYGDAGTITLLEKAGLARAKVLAITYPDFITARIAISAAHALNPSIRVIARATYEGEIGPLDALGADEIVQPEFEAGMEFVRQTLAWCPHRITEETWIAGRRSAYYDPQTPPIAGHGLGPAGEISTARNPHGAAPHPPP